MWNNYWVCSVEDKNPDKNCFSEMVKPESDRQNVRERRWQSKCSKLFQKFICKEQRSVQDTNFNGSKNTYEIKRNKITQLLLGYQSCLTLCDPIDSSPPGSPNPGILQARTLEWVAMSFSNASK